MGKIINPMKQLTDTDIENMISGDFAPDTRTVKRTVRQDLHLSRRIPPAPTPAPTHVTLDLHQYTEEQAWTAIMDIAQSGTRTATIITGASGILKIKFQQWATDSILAPYIISFAPINNGSFSVRFKRKRP